MQTTIHSKLQEINNEKSEEVLNQAKDILNKSIEIEDMLKDLGHYSKAKFVNLGNHKTKYEGFEIYVIDSIEEIAKTYNLKFGRLQHIKFENVPYDALAKLTDFKQIHGTIEKDDVFILAPADYFNDKMFEKDKDPMMFYRLGDGCYAKIAEWGEPMLCDDRVADAKYWGKIERVAGMMNRFWSGCIGGIVGAILCMIFIMTLPANNFADPERAPETRLAFSIILTIVCGVISHFIIKWIMETKEKYFPSKWDYENN